MRKIDSRIEAPVAPVLGPSVLRSIEFAEACLEAKNTDPDDRVYDEN